jgi:hypothetical protein
VLFDLEMSRFGKPVGLRPARPKTVLSFAEDLMLCPTEESALSRIHRDREAARGFRVISGDLATAVGRGNATIAIPVHQDETPFCLVASVVRLRAQEALEEYQNAWGPEA